MSIQNTVSVRIVEGLAEKARRRLTVANDDLRVALERRKGMEARVQALEDAVTAVRALKTAN